MRRRSASVQEDTSPAVGTTDLPPRHANTATTVADRPIYVTRPDLPSLDEFIPYLREIWDSRILTNAGPFHAKLEAALGEYLGVGHVSLFANGTIALVTALQALRVTGEVM